MYKQTANTPFLVWSSFFPYAEPVSTDAFLVGDVAKANTRIKDEHDVLSVRWNAGLRQSLMINWLD